MIAWRIIRLSWADCCHDWRVAMCQILALAAVMAPLLVLLGLKTGIVETLRSRLLQDPRNLEILLVGNYRLGPDWFGHLRELPEVGFVIPRTRSLSATLDVRTASGRSVEGMELVPSGPSDPLFPPDGFFPSGFDRIVLSRAAADRLGVKEEDALTGFLTRTVSGERQVIKLPLVVAAILSEDRFPRPAAFVALSLLVAAEDWRDGRADALSDPANMDTRSFASARLFARDLDGVVALAARLRAEGMEVRTRADDIEMVRAVDRVLTYIFTVLASLATGGFVLSMAAGLWADVERRKRDLALLRLVGFDSRSVALFPVTRALLVAACGIVVSLALYAIVAALFNRTLTTNLSGEGFVCDLDPWSVVIAVLLTLVLSALSAVVAMLRVLALEPAESLRDV